MNTYKLLGAAGMALISTLALGACSGTPRVPERGTVVDREHSEAWVQVIPGTTICDGKTCTTTPTQLIHHPEEWRVTIRDERNFDWKGTVTAHTSTTYDKCEVGELWPECWNS